MTSNIPYDNSNYENSRSASAAYPAVFGDTIDRPKVYPQQRWMPTTDNPYPSTFPHAKSPQHQINVSYRGTPALHGLSHSSGPFMYPLKAKQSRGPINSYERKHSAIVYPTTHSVPGPYLQSYITIPNKMYMY